MNLGKLGHREVEVEVENRKWKTYYSFFKDGGDTIFYFDFLYEIVDNDSCEEDWGTPDVMVKLSSNGECAIFHDADHFIKDFDKFLNIFETIAKNHKPGE